MTAKRSLAVLATGVALFCWGAFFQAGNHLNWPALARVIVRQVDLQKNERFLLAVKGQTFAPLVEALRSGLNSAGGEDLGVHDVDSAPRSEAEYLDLLKQTDLMIILPGPTPEDRLYRLMQELLREQAEGPQRTVHFHWAGAFALAGRPLPPSSIVDRTYQEALLELDYAHLAQRQRRFVRALRQGEVRVTTPAGTNLRFRVGDRPVTLQDGDASARRARRSQVLIDREIELPCGAVRVAPLEESVQGVIAFPADQWGGQRVDDLRMRFERGKVVEIISPTGRDAVEAELQSGGSAARSFREFALGFNPLLAVPADRSWVPYYGYGAGVVRLSLGDNSELGGQVSGDYVRWNFFIDATVEINGQLWVKDGELQDESG